MFMPVDSDCQDREPQVGVGQGLWVLLRVPLYLVIVPESSGVTNKNQDERQATKRKKMVQLNIFMF